MAHRFPSWVALLVLTGCTSGLELLVELRTDFVPGAEFVEVRTSLADPERTTTLPVAGSGSFLEGRRIAEFADLPEGRRSLRIELIAPSGEVIAERGVLLDQDITSAVTVLITRDCRGITCPGEATCVGGVCGDARCTEETPEYCPTGECTADADCPMGAACADPLCSGEICVLAADDSRCTAREYCDPELGCRERAVDAGPPDAGAMDAAPRPDGGALDGGGLDSGSTFDAGPGDGGPPDVGPPDSGPPDAGPPEILVGNTPVDCRDYFAFPLAGEERHLIAARITPPATPFVVTRIHYQLIQGSRTGVGDITASCQASLPHEILVFTASGATPPGNPSVLARVPIGTGSAVGEYRVIDERLPSPIMVPSGHHVFVAIRNAGTFPDVTCTVTCGTEMPNRTFWSNAASATYPWAELSSFGLRGDLDAHVAGYAP